MTPRAKVAWRSDGAFRSGRYSRRHELVFDGGARVVGSSSPEIVPPPLSDPTGVDPEEMLVGSVAACHMLWFLSLAQGVGLDVESYVDDATALMARDERGRIAITRIMLRPIIRFAGREPAPAEHDRLHHEAHERCFIANSIRGDVKVEASIANDEAGAG